MNKTLIILILAVIILSWNFIFSTSKRIDLTDQAKVLQGLSLALKYKTAVREFWQAKGVLPDAGMWQQEGKPITVDVSKSLVKNMEIGTEVPGSITIYFTNKENMNIAAEIEGTKIILKPEVKGDRLDWSCNGTLSKELLPKPCQ